MNLLIFNTKIDAGKGFPFMIDDDEYGHLITEILRVRRISGHAYIKTDHGALVYEITGIYSNILKDPVFDDSNTHLIVLRRIDLFTSAIPFERFVDWRGLYEYDIERCWSIAAGSY